MARGRDQRTLKQDDSPRYVSGSVPFLTIAYHPDTERVGDRQVLSFDQDGVMPISRHEPEFVSRRGDDEAPLDDPYVSRRPFLLRALDDDSVELEPDVDGTPVRAGGEPVTEAVRFTPEEVEAGVVLELAGRVVLVLHTIALDSLRSRSDDLGLVGQSTGMTRVRRQVRRVAKHKVPVLLRGESGTGKELVANAIHRECARADKPFISVNMAAVPPSTAAAALFGHSKGAFTGAVTASSGFFGAADGGTLFLDEIGETSLELQAALLRALESGEVQPVGEDRTRRVDVRLIAATDAALESAVEEGTFRRALFERLRGYQIWIPPLRDRRDDIGLLFLHFLQQQLAGIERADQLDPPPEGQRPWLPAWLVADAARHDWPGNVRELRNAAVQLAIDWADAPEIPADDEIERMFGSDRSRASHLPNQARATGNGQDPSATPAAPDPRKTGPPVSLDEESVLDALRRNSWRPAAAASTLGVSRSALYAFIQQSPNIPKASSLEAAQIEEALATHGGNTKRAAAELCVTERALKLRMRELGLG